VRQGIESFAAELAAAAVAAGTAPAAALDAMASALGQMERAGTTRDVPKLVRADMLFHHAVCDATGNDALVEFAEVLGEQLVQERAASWDLDGRVDRSLVEHRAIYDAIAVGDPNAARVALLDHLRSVGQDIDQSLLSGDAETKERGATA
jgi:DNA-binding FadR family transcriptional regulator